MKCIKVCLYMKEYLNLLHGICKEFSNLIQKTTLVFYYDCRSRDTVKINVTYFRLGLVNNNNLQI